MGTAYTTLNTRLLRRLRDASAVTWDSSDEVYDALSRSERWLARFLANIRGSGRFVTTEALTVTASATSTAISSLGSAATKEFTSVRQIEKVGTNSRRIPVEQIPEGDEHLWRGSTTTTIDADQAPGYYIQDASFYWLPVSTGAQTMYVTYNWIPVAKTSSGTAETPADYDDVLLLRAAYDLLGAEGEREQTFEAKYAARLSEIEEYECSRHDRGLSKRVKNVSTRVLFGW